MVERVAVDGQDGSDIAQLSLGLTLLRPFELRDDGVLGGGDVGIGLKEANRDPPIQAPPAKTVDRAE